MPAGTILFCNLKGRALIKGVYYSRAGTIEKYQNSTSKITQKALNSMCSISNMANSKQLRAQFKGGYYSHLIKSGAGTIQGRVLLKDLRYLITI